MAMYVVKRDGRQEPVHFDKITARINKLSYGLNPDFCDPVSPRNCSVRSGNRFPPLRLDFEFPVVTPDPQTFVPRHKPMLQTIIISFITESTLLLIDTSATIPCAAHGPPSVFEDREGAKRQNRTHPIFMHLLFRLVSHIDGKITC